LRARAPKLPMHPDPACPHPRERQALRRDLIGMQCQIRPWTNTWRRPLGWASEPSRGWCAQWRRLLAGSVSVDQPRHRLYEVTRVPGRPYTLPMPAHAPLFTPRHESTSPLVLWGRGAPARAVEEVLDAVRGARRKWEDRRRPPMGRISRAHPSANARPSSPGRVMAYALLTAYHLQLTTYTYHVPLATYPTDRSTRSAVARRSDDVV